MKLQFFGQCPTDDFPTKLQPKMTVKVNIHCKWNRIKIIICFYATFYLIKRALNVCLILILNFLGNCIPQSHFNDMDMIIVYNEVPTEILQPPPCLTDQVRLVCLHGDGGTPALFHRKVTSSCAIFSSK